MKTSPYSLKQLGLAAGIALALTSTGWFAPTLRAQEAGSARGGAAQLMPKTWNWWNTTPPGPATGAPAKHDIASMPCPKCQTVAVTLTNVEKGHIVTTTPGAKHLCAACDSRLVTEGYGHQAATKLVHSCTNCGVTDPACCATHPGERTPGMTVN